MVVAVEKLHYGEVKATGSNNQADDENKDNANPRGPNDPCPMSCRSE